MTSTKTSAKTPAPAGTTSGPTAPSAAPAPVPAAPGLLRVELDPTEAKESRVRANTYDQALLDALTSAKDSGETLGFLVTSIAANIDKAKTRIRSHAARVGVGVRLGFLPNHKSGPVVTIAVGEPMKRGPRKASDK